MSWIIPKRVLIIRLFDSRMLRSSSCESLRTLAHSNCVNVNKAALRVVLKTENIILIKRTSNTKIRFLYTLQLRFLLSPFPIAVWITVFARFDRCLNLL